MIQETRKSKFKFILLVLVVGYNVCVDVSAWSFPDPSLPAGYRSRPYSGYSDMPPSYDDRPAYYDDGYDTPPPPYYNRDFNTPPYYRYNGGVNMQPPSSYYNDGRYDMSSGYDSEINTRSPSNSQIGNLPSYYNGPVDRPPQMTALEVDKNGVDVASRSDFFASTMSQMDNPLLHRENCLPKFSRIKNHHVSPALEEKIETMKTEFELFESYLNMSYSARVTKGRNATMYNSQDWKTGQLSYLLDEFDRIKHTLDHTWNIVSHLHAVKNDNEFRQIHDFYQMSVLKAMSEFSQSKPLFDALQKQLKEHLKSKETRLLKKALKSIKANCSMVPVESIITDEIFVQQQEQRAAETILRSMKEGGIGMRSKQDQDRLNEIQLRLASLATKFSNNILDETQALFLTVGDRTLMHGVPESILRQWNDAHRKEMTRQGYSGGSDARFPNDPAGFNGWSSNGPSSYEEQQYEEELWNYGWKMGPWRITLDQSSYISAMKHIPNRALRKQIYMAHLQRASELTPEKNNIPVIEEILRLKKEMANLLGYDNYAELSLSSKMASSTDAITKLTDMVAEKALPVANKELKEITNFAHASGGLVEMDATGYRYEVPLEPWDISYWTERLKESKFDLTEEQLRPYFAHHNVIQGLFQLVNRLFDVTIKEDFADAWHQDVSFYSLYDNASEKHIASFYLDPYFRPVNKQGGAWMSSCVSKSRALHNDIPVAYVSYNVNPPDRGKPSLLTFREVETIFHEFGHALQHLLTTASVGEVSGINGIEWDAVEIPSQFMERWCYDRDTLYSFARHWQTHQALPEAMYEKLLEQKVFGAGMKTCKQLYYGQLDLALHGKAYNEPSISGGSQQQQPPPPSIFEIQRKVAQKYLPSSMPSLLKEDRYLCSFSHIFAGGYSAGYYSYLWADLMSADAFGAFEDIISDDAAKKEEQVRMIGKRFRDTFLSLGGGIPPDQVFEIFRGRSPTPKALLEQSGLQ